MNAKQILQQAYGDSKNPIADQVQMVGKIGERAAFELARGELCGQEVWGVAVAVLGPQGEKAKKGDLDISLAVDSQQQALEHIAKLKELVRQDPRLFDRWYERGL